MTSLQADVCGLMKFRECLPQIVDSEDADLFDGTMFQLLDMGDNSTAISAEEAGGCFVSCLRGAAHCDKHTLLSRAVQLGWEVGDTCCATAVCFPVATDLSLLRASKKQFCFGRVGG